MDFRERESVPSRARVYLCEESEILGASRGKKQGNTVGFGIL